MVDGAHVWTSARAHDAAARIGSALIDRGVAPGERVVLWMPTSRFLVAAFTGTLRAGAVAVVIGANLPAAELARIVADCAAAAVITPADLAPSVPVAITRAARVVIADDPMIAYHAPLERPIPRADGDVAQLVYTSGTTGAPRAVAWTHGTVAARYAGLAEPRRAS